MSAADLIRSPGTHRVPRPAYSEDSSERCAAFLLHAGFTNRALLLISEGKMPATQHNGLANRLIAPTA